MTNIKLSSRLEKIAEKVPQGAILFDVGSDHAYLPCSLVLRGQCPKAYAADLRQGPLQAAQKNITRYSLQGKVVPLLSDGLEKLQEDATCLSIAGMGCHTAIEILEKGRLSQFEVVIVQVNRKVEIFRSWLNSKNYGILSEDVVEDDGFYYEVIVFSPHICRHYSDIEILLGPNLLCTDCSLKDKYWHQKLEEWQRIDQAQNNSRYREAVVYLNQYFQNRRK